MPYPNEHSCELGTGNYDRYRRENCQRKHDGKCIDAVWGIKGDKTEVSSLRYKTDIWTESAARSHCKDEGGTFEAASDEEENLLPFPGNIPPKPWYTMDSTEDSAEIEIFDIIGGWFGVEVGQFKKDFDKIKNKKEIKVLINSPGGSVFDGMAIYNILAAYKSKITTEIIGIAASIASVVALAGKTRNICQGSYFMIHDPSGICIGTVADMEKMAETLEKIGGQIANIYTRNSTLTKEDILQKMKDETWYTADEAIEAGLADNIVDYGEIAALAFDISSFHNAPENVRELAARKEQEQKPVSDSTDGGELGGNEMPGKSEIDELKAQLAQRDEEIAELTKKLAKVELKVEKFDLVLSEKQDLAKELADLKAKIVKDEKEQVIEKALSEGKITPKNRTRWEEQYDRDPEGTKKLLEEQEPVVDLSTRGTGAGGDESSLNAEEQEIADKAELSKEDIKKYGPRAGKEK